MWCLAFRDNSIVTARQLESPLRPEIEKMADTNTSNDAYTVERPKESQMVTGS